MRPLPQSAPESFKARQAWFCHLILFSPLFFFPLNLRIHLCIAYQSSTQCRQIAFVAALHFPSEAWALENPPPLERSSRVT